jgi:hypothetical protein
MPMRMTPAYVVLDQTPSPIDQPKRQTIAKVASVQETGLHQMHWLKHRHDLVPGC